MTTVHTYNAVKQIYPETVDYVIDKIRLFESEGLIRTGDDLTHGQIRTFADNIKPKEVEYSTITDPREYVHKFDEIIYKTLVDIGKMKDLEAHQFSSSELLEEIRESIIKIASKYWLPISPPEYKLGDIIYVDNEECKIILLADNLYGILSLQYHNVIARGTGTFNEFINRLEEEGRLTVDE